MPPKVEGTPAFDTVANYIAKHASQGTYKPGVTWPKFSDEWYWEVLLGVRPFRSVFEDQGLRQPLIWTVTKNLSQTAREQCDLEGLAKEGLDREGPGQEVEIDGLQARPDLNGKRGRVLPTSGRGAPPSAPAAGRIAVRVAPEQPNSTPEVVAVKAINLRSPHAPSAAASGSSAGADSSASGQPQQLRQQARQQQQQQQQQEEQQSSTRQRILDLLEEEFKLWKMGSTLKPVALRGAGLKDTLIRCSMCEKGAQQVERFVALKRSAPLRARPLPHSSVNLVCLDCFVGLAEASRMPLTAAGAEKFCDGCVMGPMEACMIIQGLPMAQWGGSSGFSGHMY